MPTSPDNDSPQRPGELPAVPAEQTPAAPPPADAEPAFDNNAPDYFAPSWWRALFVVVTAFLAFLIPQEIALEWYPLNEPGKDIHYLEATLRTSNTGEIRILYDCGFGFVEPYSITIPVAPSDMAFTYTFPLPDAPIRKLFIDPPDAAGELEFTRLRLINRREEEVRNFNRTEFILTPPGLKLEPTEKGWKLVAAEGTSFDAGADVTFDRVFPQGMTGRNVKRCLLSWSYLSFMLWLICLAVYFAVLNHRRGKDILKAMAFLAFICLCMSVVGARGLIKNTHHISKIKPERPVPAGHTVEVEMLTDKPGTLDLVIQGRTPEAPRRITTTLEPHALLQTAVFAVPDLTTLESIELQSPDPTSRIEIRSVRLRDGAKFTRRFVPALSLQPTADTKTEIHRDLIWENLVLLPNPATAAPPVAGSPSPSRGVRLGAADLQAFAKQLNPATASRDYAKPQPSTRRD